MEKRVKGNVYMDRGEERFRERLHEDPFYDEQPLNELTNDVTGALIKGTKPEATAVDFNRYEKAEKVKDVKQVVNGIQKK